MLVVWDAMVLHSSDIFWKGVRTDGAHGHTHGAAMQH